MKHWIQQEEQREQRKYGRENSFLVQFCDCLRLKVGFYLNRIGIPMEKVESYLQKASGRDEISARMHKVTAISSIITLF